MNRALPSALATVALALALVGCSSSDDAATVKPAATLAVPTATPSPTPTAMTIDEAGDRYLDLVKPGNKALDRISDDVVGKSAGQLPLKKAKADAKKFADAMSVELRGFADPSLWPKNVRKQIEKMSELSASDLTAARSMSKARTRQDFLGEWNDFAANRAGADTGQLIRARLDLPEIPQ